MKRKLVCVHGNPGQPTDYSRILKNNLFQNFDHAFFDSSLNKSALLSDDIQQLASLFPDDTEINYICYSWGSYLTLQYLIKSGKTADTIVMLNPTLYSSEGISPLIRGLAAIPILGNLLLGRLAPGLAGSFIEKSFAPESPNLEVSKELTEFLAKAAVWRRAMRRKEEMYQNPIKDIPKIANKIIIIRGKEDHSIAWNSQNAVVQLLQSHNTVSINAIDGAGHNLLWSHLPETVDVLKGSDYGKSLS